MKPQPQVQLPGELARSVSTPAAVFAAEPHHLAREVPLLQTGLAKPAAGNTLSATSILRALHRRQLQALGAALLLAGICGPAAYYLVPRAKFKAKAQLQLGAHAPKILFHTVDSEGSDDYKRYQNTQQALVKSQLALSAALRNKEVSNYRMIREQVDPIGWLQENLKVEFITASELMEISLSGDDPQQLAGIVNAVKNAYIDEVVNVDIKMRTARHDQLSKLKLKYAEMLKERRETLKTLAQTVGSDDKQTIAYAQQIAMAHRDNIRNELVGVQSQKRRLQARLQVHGQRPEDGIEEPSAPSFSEAEIDEWIEHDPAVAGLAAKLAHEEDAWQTANARLHAAARKPLADPSLRHLKQEKAATEQALKSKRAELRAIAVRELQKKIGGGDHPAAGGDSTETELAYLEVLERDLSKELASISEEIRP